MLKIRATAVCNRYKVNQEQKMTFSAKIPWSPLNTRAVLNRGLLLFDRIRIIQTIFRPNANRIRTVALNFEVISLSFIVTIAIHHHCFLLIIHHLDLSLTLTQFHIKFALRKTKCSRFSASKHERLSSA